MKQRTKKYLGIVALAAIDSIRASIHTALIGEPVWVSVNGTVWRYSEMTDQHLSSAIRMLRREGEAGSAVCQALEDEQARRDENRRRGYSPARG